MANIKFSQIANGGSINFTNDQVLAVRGGNVDILASLPIPIAISAGTNSTSGGTANFSNANGISFGMDTTGNVTASYTVPSVPAQTNQTVGIYAVGNTTQGSSGTLDARSFSVNADGIISAGFTNGSLELSVPAPPAQTVQTQNVVVPSAGTQTATSGTVSFANSNGISFGMSGSNQITASYTVPNVPAQTVQTEGYYALGNTTGQSSSTTLDARTHSIQGGGGVSVGYSNGSVLISGPQTAAQTAQTIGVYAISNTTGASSSSTIDARSFSIEGAGVASVGLTNGTFVISVPSGGGGALSAGVSTGGHSVGTSGTVSNALIFAGGNNITLSQATGAGGNTITISGANAIAQSNQNISLFALGNTTQNSSTVLNASNLSFNGLGIITAGYSNGSIQLSATTAAQTAQTQNVVVPSAGTQTATSGTVVFSNSNGISFGMSGSSQITASYTVPNVPAQTNQTVGFYGVGNTTQNSSTTLDARTVSLDGLGGITVGYSNGSIQISGPQTVAQTNQTVGLYALGNTTQNSSTTLDARTLSFNGLGIITAGFSNGSIQISATTAAQTNQTIGFFATGNTTQNSSTTLDARSITINGLGIASVGFSNGSIDISVPSGGGGGVALYDGANSITSGTARFTNANGVSFSFNGQTISASVAAQTNQTVGFYAVGNTTQSSSTTLDARTVSYNFLGAATGGYSNGSIDISVPVQTNQTLGVFAPGLLTFDNTSGTADARSLSFVGSGAISIGITNGSVAISAPLLGATGAFTAGVSTLGNTSGGTAMVSNQIIFAGGNNITLSESNLLGSATITISAANQTNQTEGWLAVGNTTGQSSSTTLDARSISIKGTGGVSVGMSNGSVIISGAAGGGAAGATLSYFVNLPDIPVIGTPILAAGRFCFVPLQIPYNLSVGYIRNLVSINGLASSIASTANTSYSMSQIVSESLVLYTLGSAASSGSLFSISSVSVSLGFSVQCSQNSTNNISVSQGFSWPLSNGGSTSSSFSYASTVSSMTIYTSHITNMLGLKVLDFGISGTLSAGQYYLASGYSAGISSNGPAGLNQVSSNVNFAGATQNTVAINQMGLVPSTPPAVFSYGFGSYSNGGNSSVGSLDISQISRSQSDQIPYYQFIGMTG